MQVLLSYNCVISEWDTEQKLGLPGTVLALISSVAPSPECWEAFETAFPDSPQKLCLLAHGGSMGQLAL